MTVHASLGQSGFWRTTWWLTAARWHIAKNGFLRAAHWRRLTYALVALALGFLALAALGASYVMTRVIIQLSDPTSTDPVVFYEIAGKADVIVASVLSGMLVLSFLVSFTIALATLFLSKDLDLLLSAPISRRAVLASKLIGGLLPAHLIVFAVSAVPLIGHGLGMRQEALRFGLSLYDAGYYLALLLAMFLLPILPASIGALAVLGIVRRVSAHRLGEIVALIVVAITLSIALVAGTANQLQQVLSFRDMVGIFERVRVPYSPAEWLTVAVAASGRHEWALAARWFGQTALLALAALLPLTWISEKLYFDGWLHMQATKSKRQTRRPLLPWNRVDRPTELGRPSGLLRWFSPATAAVIRKDWRVIPRDLTNMAQVLSPLSIGIFFILQQLLYPVRLGGGDTTQTFLVPLLVMFSAAIAGSVGGMIMVRFGLTAFSMEGKTYWVIKGSPIKPRELVRAKFLVAYIPYLGLSFALVLLLEAARSISAAVMSGQLSLGDLAASIRPELMLYAWFVVAVVGAGNIAINLALGAARPNLSWDTPHEMLTPDVGCLSLVFYGSYGAVTGLALILPAALSRFPVPAAHLAMWIVGIGLGAGLTLLVVGSALALAEHELVAVGE